MKRILHLIAQRPEKTGSGTYLQALIEQGKHKDYSQAVIAGIPACEKGPYFDKNIQFYPVCFETEELPFPVAGMTDIMPYKSTMYRHMTAEMYSHWRNAFTKKVSKAIEEFQPDVILAHHLWLLSSITKELFPNIPMIALCHGTDLRQMKLAPQFREYVAKTCRRIDHIAALHEEQKRNIIEEYGISAEKITVVGAGFNPDIFYRDDTQKQGSPLRLIYAGKLNFAKGVPSLIRAYNALPVEKEKIRLAFAGSGTGEQCQAIETMVKQSPLQIDLKGIVPQTKLAELFRKSHIFVFSSFYEGLPLVLLEALACGLRIVTTDLPGVKAFLGNAVNSRGIVEYVPLPALKSIDEPVESSLASFEERFSTALFRQMKAAEKEPSFHDKDIDQAVAAMTWSAVFNKIEALF